MRYTIEQFKKIIAEEILIIPRKRSIRNFITHYYDELPEFYRENTIQNEQFQVLMNNKTRYKKYLIKEININNLYGRAWLFQGLDNANKNDKRPNKERLEILLPRLLRNEKIPEIDEVYDLGDGKYLIDDGCHRIYSAYLAGKQTVTCKIRGEIKKS
ncbi:MAG: hypothetical protein J6M57_01490 [Acidaminococcaceae bacterium]|nr:hypothetical protein [Acidaminococcaceae bacterium]